MMMAHFGALPLSVWARVALSLSLALPLGLTGNAIETQQ